MALQNITITATQPAAMVAAENPIVVSLSTGSVGSPDFAKAKLKVNNTGTNGDTIVFDLTGFTTYSKTFTGKYFPNRDDYFLASDLRDADGNNISTTITTSNIASSIADCLRKDVIISNAFNINFSGGTIVELVSKEAGTKYDLSGRVTCSDSSITFSVSSTGANQYQGSLIRDYSLYVECYVADIDEEFKKPNGAATFDLTKFNYVSELVLPFSIDNIHRFDFSKICKTFVSTPRPDFELTGFTTFENLDDKWLRGFTFRYGETYPLVPGENVVKKLYKGSISKPVWVCNASLPLTSSNDLTYLSGGTNISGYTFSTAPAIKQSFRSQRELIYQLVGNDLNRDGALYVDIQYWDGTSQNDIKLYDVFSGATNYGGVYITNVSHEFCLAQFETGSTKIKQASFNLRTWTGGTDYILKRTFQYPYSEPDNLFQVAFLNTLGAFETFCFQGLVENTIDRTKKDITKPLALNANGSIDQGFQYSGNYDVQVTKKVIVNSGLIDQNHFDWLMELLKSNEIYEVASTTVNYLKLDSFKYSKNSSSNDYEVEVTFLQTIFENNISK